MALYVAYGVLVMHVALGADAGGPPRVHSDAARRIVRAGHAAASRRRVARARGRAGSTTAGSSVGPPDSIPDKRARIVAAPDGERIAVFRDGSQIGALTNLCAHQNGPLGEGCIINGCVTCPWHGYEYRLEDGCAPPPFTEKLATYRVRLRDGIVEVDPQRAAAGDEGRDHPSRRSANRLRNSLLHPPACTDCAVRTRVPWPPPMNILLLGSGGREHALAWKIAASPADDRLWCAPGNAGIAQEAECVRARHHRPRGGGRVLQGEQGRLRRGRAGGAAGRRHRRRSRGGRLQDLRPDARPRRGSKAPRASPRTCAGRTTSRPPPTSASPRPRPPRPTRAQQGAPIVIKADGLAAGKGVIIAADDRRGRSRDRHDVRRRARRRPAPRW